MNSIWGFQAVLPSRTSAPSSNMAVTTPLSIVSVCAADNGRLPRPDRTNGQNAAKYGRVRTTRINLMSSCSSIIQTKRHG